MNSLEVGSGVKWKRNGIRRVGLIEFDFWMVHGIMNTSGLLLSKNFTKDPKY